MKKIIAILLLVVLAISIAGCAEKEAPKAPVKVVEPEEPEPEPEPVVVEAEEPEVEEEPEPEVTDPDYFKMSESEFGDTVEVRNVDTTIDGITATLDYVHATIRNYDIEDLKPRIVVQLIGQNKVNEVKEFYLDPLPKGYMMRKRLDMDNMNIPEAKLMKVVAVTLVDENQELKEIFTGKMEFIPITG
jgi:hypothetical protein